MNPTLIIKPKGRARLEILLGEAGSQAGGIGGWGKIGRQQRQSITHWLGQDGYELTVPVVFDGFAEDRSVEQGIARLEQLGRRGAGDEHPPVVEIDGPLPHTDLPWVIQDVAWGAQDRREDGRRVRQHAVITFWEHIDPDLTVDKRQRSAAHQSQDRNGHKGGSHKTYTVKRGDTLSSIAARKLGNANRWRAIADLNNIRDPRNIRIGQVLRLP